jgi:hypothetical protein
VVISPISEPVIVSLASPDSAIPSIIFASISVTRPQGKGMMLGRLRTLPIS